MGLPINIRDLIESRIVENTRMNKNELLTVLDEGLSSGWISKSEYDYEKLVKEREEKEKEQLYAAFKKGKRTLQGVLNYIKGKADI